MTSTNSHIEQLQGLLAARDQWGYRAFSTRNAWIACLTLNAAWIIPVFSWMMSYNFTPASTLGLVAAITITTSGAGLTALLPSVIFPETRKNIQNRLKARRPAIDALHIMGRSDLVSEIQSVYQDGKNNDIWWSRLDEILDELTRTNQEEEDLFSPSPSEVIAIEDMDTIQTLTDTPNKTHSHS